MFEIGLSPSAVQQTQGSGATAPVPDTVTLTAFSRDRVLFDSGVALGQAAADVPLSGTSTASAGTQVEARAVPETGSPTPWQTIASIAGDGSFAGTLSGVALSTAWYRAEVRLAGQGVVTAQATRFGVGHVLTIWGQSEIHQMLTAAHDIIAAPTVTDEEALQIVAPNDSTRAPEHQFVTNADPRTGTMAAMANVFAATRPGEKFCVVFNVLSGTGWRSLVEDANAGRNWSEDKAIHDFATQDGQQVGVAMASWFAAPGSLAADYEDALFPILFGCLSDGTAIPELAGGTPASSYTHTYGSGQSLVIDHTFEELYDYAHTRWLGYGPHKFSPAPGGDLENAITLVGGAQQTNLRNKELARQSWRNMIANPHGHFLSTPGLEPLNYLNGEDNGAGGWSDTSHPADDTPDGLYQLARLTAHAYLQGVGLAGWSVPVFDQSYWEPAGAYMEIWSSAGAITTTRAERALPALPGTYPHWTDVSGFEINDIPAERVEIAAGRVRVYRNAAADPFIASDVITFGKGGASGLLLNPADYQNDLWMNWPIVDVGATDVDGIAVSALPDPAVLANPLVDSSVPASFATLDLTGVGGTLAAFQNPSSLGAGVSALTVELWVYLDSANTGYMPLTAAQSTTWNLEGRGSNGNLRLTVEDNGAAVVSYQNIGTIPTDQWVRLRLAIDLTAGLARVLVDGSQVGADVTWTPGAGVFQSSRRKMILGGGGIARIGSYQDWHSVAATLGDLPGTTPTTDIPEGTDWATHAWRTANGVLS